MKRRTKVGLAVAVASLALSVGLGQLPSVQTGARHAALRVALTHPSVVRAGAAFGLMGCSDPDDPITTLPSRGKGIEAFSFAATASSSDDQTLDITVAVTTTRTEFVELSEGDQLIVLEEGESPVVLTSKLVPATTRVPNAVAGSQVPVYTASISRATGIRRPFLAFRRNAVTLTKATLPLFEVAPESIVLAAGAPVTFRIEGPFVEDELARPLTFSVRSANTSCAWLGSQIALRDGMEVTSQAPLGGSGGGKCTGDLHVEAKGVRVPFEERSGQYLTIDVVRIEEGLPVEARRTVDAGDAGSGDAAIGDAGAD